MVISLLMLGGWEAPNFILYLFMNEYSFFYLF
jgi:hypothetical protein